MMRLLWSLRILVAAIVAAWSYNLLLWTGPDVEARVAPVLTRQRIEAVSRTVDGREACFIYRFDKNRRAEPVDANWTIRSEGRTWPFQAVRTVADSGPIVAGLKTRPVAPDQWSHKCIAIPADLGDAAFRITGFTEYRTGATGWLWTIRQASAEVDVP